MRGAVINARTVELRKVLQWQLSILSASRDHDRTAGHFLISVDLQCVRTALTRETLCILRDQHLGTKLLCLRVSISGKRLTGDAGRKSQVVLDLRARASLSTRRIAFDDQYVKTL